MQHYNIKFSYFKALPVATPTLGDQGAIRLPLAVVDPQKPLPPLFLDWRLPPPPLSQGLDPALPGSPRMITTILSRQLFPKNTGNNAEGVF